MTDQTTVQITNGSTTVVGTGSVGPRGPQGPPVPLVDDATFATTAATTAPSSASTKAYVDAAEADAVAAAVQRANHTGTQPVATVAGLQIALDAKVNLDTAQLITGLKTFSPSATSAVGLIVKGVASQTADLQQWQNSAGSAVALMSSAGALTATGLEATTSASGVVLRSPNGTRYRVTVSDAGALVVAPA